MNVKTETSDPEAGIYRSGVAARLAGIPVETLRVWERRHGVARPRKSGGRQRLYTPADIRRLTLVKRLVDMGHPISAVAGLPTDVMGGMCAASTVTQGSPAQARDGAAAREVRAVLVGPLLIAARIAESLAGSPLKVVGSFPDPMLAAAALQAVHAEVVVIELPTPDEDCIALVAAIKAACGAAKAIILYRYAPSALIRRLRIAGHAVARASSDAAEIESICLSLLNVPVPVPQLDRVAGYCAELPAPMPRFDQRVLADLANASSTVYCECPRHLVDLVLSLGSFERYSAACANRGPEDAALHRDLERTAGHARAIIEEALARVIAAEGLASSAEAAPTA